MTTDDVLAPGAVETGGPPSPEDRVAEEVAQVFQLLLRGIKNIGIFRHVESRYSEFLDPSFKALVRFLEEHEVLPLKLGPYTLHYKKRVIYEEQNKESLTYKFFRDGMRYLMFRQGIPADELLRFVLLSVDSYSEAALFQEDMITRLWKEDFSAIEYVVVEGFEFGDVSEAEVEVQVEKIIAYLRKQLAASGTDITRFARLELDDLDLELSDIDQVRGGIISGRPASQEDKAWVQQELYTEEKQRLFAKMVLILFQILEHEASEEDRNMMSDSFLQVLDTLLLSEDVKGCVALLLRFDTVIDRPLTDARRDLVTRIRDDFRKRMAEPQRLDAVGQYISLAKNLDGIAVRTYLSVCSGPEILPLVDILAAMERSEGRRLLVEILAELGKGQCEIFARRLDHNSSNVVKDMLAIIDRIDPPDKISIFAKCLEHPNVMIRLEGLKIISKSQSDGALRYLERAMKDEDLQMRIGAYRALTARSAARAGPILQKLMQSEDYAAKDSRERVAIVIALADTKSAEALEFFSSILDVKANLFTRTKQNELKLMAIMGLSAMKTVAAFKVLAREVKNRSHSKEVLEAAHKAALRLRGELMGQRKGDG